jgi:Ras-related protein Rab-7L1
MGVDFALKIINENNTEIKVQMWDIAGQERFSNMTRVYYRGKNKKTKIKKGQ